MSAPDVVIVGGAITGAATAWFLSRQPGFQGRVMLIEKDPAYRRCSTTLSLSSIRQQFSTPVNVQISRFGFEFLRSVQSETYAAGGIGLVERGYLTLASPAGEARLRQNVALQLALGADIELLDAPRLGSRYPWMDISDTALGAYGRSGEGWFDAYQLLQYFLHGARERGVEIVAGKVSTVELENSRVSRVGLADGRVFPCGCLLNAAGTGATALAQMAGIRLPVETRKRCVYVVDCPAAELTECCPHLIDHSGLFLKPLDGFYATGATPRPSEDVACNDFLVDYGYFEERVWPLLASRVPCFAELKLTHAWAGHYAYNLLDQNAIIGAHPEITNFYFANGFSGHGVQQAPAVGRGLSELITYGKFQTLDLGDLGFERILAGSPFREHNVI